MTPTRTVKISATCTTEYVAIVDAPAHWTDEQVISYYKHEGSRGEFEEASNDWVWDGARTVDEDDSVDPDETRHTIQPVYTVFIRAYMDMPDGQREEVDFDTGGEATGWETFVQEDTLHDQQQPFDIIREEDHMSFEAAKERANALALEFVGDADLFTVI